MRLFLVAFLLTGLSSAGARACYEPSSSPPSCTMQYGNDGFSDEWEFDSCKRDIERYKQEHEEWISCLNDELEDLSHQVDQAVSTSQENVGNAVKKFNCKASAESYCF